MAACEGNPSKKEEPKKKTETCSIIVFEGRRDRKTDHTPDHQRETRERKKQRDPAC